MSTTQSLSGQTDDPIAAALAEEGVRRRLQNAALATLRRWQSGLPLAQRTAEAEEVVQEAARRALKRRSDYEPGRSVERWLVGFVVMVCRERVKDRRAVAASATAGEDALPLENRVLDLCRPVAEVVAERDDVRQMLDLLPPEDRDILRMRFFDSATALEIGKRLGISPGAVRVRLHRALTKLKDETATRGEAQP